MHRRWLFAALISSAACGGSSHGSGAGPSAGAGGSVESAGSSVNDVEGGGISGTASGLAGAAAGEGGAGGASGSAGAAIGGAFSAGSSGTSSAGGATMGGSSGTQSTLGCAGWRIETEFSMQGTAAVVGGALVLSRPVGSKTYDDGPTLTQTGLSGDFDITVSWQDFVPGDSVQGGGPTFNAAVLWTAASGAVYSASAFVGGAFGEASIIHGQQFTNDALPLSATFYAGASGSFRIQRVGTSMTVTTTIDGHAVTAQSTEPFAEQPLRFSLWMNDNNAGSGAAPKAAGVTVTKVALSGGGGSVKPDDFSCP